MSDKLTIEQAIELAGGKSRLGMAYNFPLFRLVSIAKSEDGLIDAKVFLANLKHCQGEAARNAAENKIKNQIMIKETAEKLDRKGRPDDDDHHHFMP